MEWQLCNNPSQNNNSADVFWAVIIQDGLTHRDAWFGWLVWMPWYSFPVTFSLSLEWEERLTLVQNPVATRGQQRGVSVCCHLPCRSGKPSSWHARWMTAVSQLLTYGEPQAIQHIVSIPWNRCHHKVAFAVAVQDGKAAKAVFSPNDWLSQEINYLFALLKLKQFRKQGEGKKEGGPIPTANMVLHAAAMKIASLKGHHWVKSGAVSKPTSCRVIKHFSSPLSLL